MRKLAVGIGLVLLLAAVGVGVAIAASGAARGAKAVTQAPREPTAGATRLLRSRSWRLRAVHGRVVVIRYTEGDCWGGGMAHTSERKKSVMIELLQPFSGGAGVACPQFLTVRSLSVHLKAPLGHRRLLHAPLGAAPG
jgi:hypothetical protein